MHPVPIREEALRLLRLGVSPSEVSRQLGVSRTALRDWSSRGVHPSGPRRSCWSCDAGAPPDPNAYALLLGYYLGDGCISRTRRTYSLRVSCDRTHPGIVRDVSEAIVGVHRRAKVSLVGAPGVWVVQSWWNHWPCVFPQHGPGRKHDRVLQLEQWQREIVGSHPAAFLRGLFHSDGCRVNNWTTRAVAGERKRYDYPRWQFVNNSDDIRRFCTEALDLLQVPWRQSNWKTVSVSTREGVARLDTLIGPKR